MATDKATHHLHMEKVPGRVKAALIGLVLIAAGIAAVIVAENVGQPLHAVAGPAAKSFASASIDATAVPDNRLAADDYRSGNLNDRISLPVSPPRECRLEQGIVDNCTFQ